MSKSQDRRLTIQHRDEHEKKCACDYCVRMSPVIKRIRKQLSGKELELFDEISTRMIWAEYLIVLKNEDIDRLKAELAKKDEEIEKLFAELKARIESTINFVHNMGGIAQLKDCCRVVCTDVEAVLKGEGK